MHEPLRIGVMKERRAAAGANRGFAVDRDLASLKDLHYNRHLVPYLRSLASIRFAAVKVQALQHRSH